ncbi:MAG TPA: GNAT family N-acetyltransferase, partial [Symbiobacteriaceae bacterium]|nr:GNAT family N-acetyltransferase [Symbiobacteriaceae bacterium]
MAHAVSARRIDHALRTVKGYEGRGFATACTHATIMEGVRRGLEPIWITEVDNRGSRAIAEKIGLKLHDQYMPYERA